MTTAACTRLPRELVDAIVDEFHSDTKTLATCSLVCKAWLPSTRRHLFAIVRLSVASCPTVAQRHAWVQLSTSSAVPFIRHLKLVGSCSLFERKQFRVNEYLPQLVNFVHVESLSLTGISGRWLDTSFIRNFTNIVSLSLRIIFFDVFFDLSGLVCAFPSLQSIRIEWLDAGCFSLPLPSHRLPFNLQNLDLQCSMEQTGKVLDWLLSFEKTPAIHTISLCHYPLGPVIRFLRATGHTLERISFQFGDVHDIPGFIPSCLTQLCFIHFDLTDCQPFKSEMVMELLSQIVSTRVEEVVFNLGFDTADDDGDCLDCRRLDMLFTQPQFSELKKVQIFYVGELQLVDIADLFGKRLPGCQARGILRLNLGLWAGFPHFDGL